MLTLQNRKYLNKTLDILKFTVKLLELCFLLFTCEEKCFILIYTRTDVTIDPKHTITIIKLILKIRQKI